MARRTTTETAIDEDFSFCYERYRRPDNDQLAWRLVANVKVNDQDGKLMREVHLTDVLPKLSPARQAGLAGLATDILAAVIQRFEVVDAA